VAKGGLQPGSGTQGKTWIPACTGITINEAGAMLRMFPSNSGDKCLSLSDPLPGKAMERQ
jgi:hypothetical protein